MKIFFQTQYQTKEHSRSSSKYFAKSIFFNGLVCSVSMKSPKISNLQRYQRTTPWFLMIALIMFVFQPFVKVLQNVFHKQDMFPFFTNHLEQTSICWNIIYGEHQFEQALPFPLIDFPINYGEKLLSIAELDVKISSKKHKSFGNIPSTVVYNSPFLMLNVNRANIHGRNCVNI